jgi:hypothetical protein
MSGTMTLSIDTRTCSSLTFRPTVHAKIRRMTTRHEAFDASLARVVDACRNVDKRPGPYDRAWFDFWHHHFEDYLKMARVVAARDPHKLANHLHAVEEELVERVVKRIRSGKPINRKVINEILNKSIAQVKDDLVRLGRQDIMRGTVERLRNLHASADADDAEMRKQLNQVIADLNAGGKRSKLKARVLHAILTEDVFKKNGEINLAEVARVLEIPGGTVNSAFSEIRREMPQQYPELRELFEADREFYDGELIAIVERNHDDD